MLTIYENLMKEDGTLLHERDLKTSIKTISSRWIELVRRSDDLTNLIEQLYQSWFLFESELNSFRDQILSPFEQRLHSIAAADLNKFLDLNRINVNLNDLKVKESSSNQLETIRSFRFFT